MLSSTAVPGLSVVRHRADTLRVLFADVGRGTGDHHEHRVGGIDADAVIVGDSDDGTPVIARSSDQPVFLEGQLEERWNRAAS